MTKNELIRLLFSISLMPVGALMIVLHSETPSGILLLHIGFAFLVAGVLSSFHEGVLRRFEQGETATAIAEEVVNKLKLAPLSATGIKCVSAIRKSYSGYYTWAMSTKPEENFFAGRSVLHRIDEDFKHRELSDAATVLARRLSEGAKIKILLLDPRSDVIPRLAEEEGQSTNKLLLDLAISLGVCRRLYKLLAARTLPPSARLDICVFDEIPYFAYHSVGDMVIVGFYFSSILGHQSAAFEVVDPQTRAFFADHFHSIFARTQARGTNVLRFNSHDGRVELNEILFEDLRASIVAAVGEVDDL
jgi:hypothetical protein